MEEQKASSLDSTTELNNTDYIFLLNDIENNVVEKILKTDFEKKLAIDARTQLKNNVPVNNLPNEAIYGSTQYGNNVATNLNTITKSGFYSCVSSATGVPTNSYDWLVFHIADGANMYQFACAVNSTIVAYERIYINNTWEDWTLRNSDSGGGVSEFNSLGTISGNFTLVENKITTGYVNGNYTTSLPTVTDTTQQVTCILDFTTSNSAYPTINKYINLTGTFAVTNGDATVTGTNSILTSEVVAGSKINIAGTEYTVSSITSNNALELTTIYTGSTASGLTLGRNFIKWSNRNSGKAPATYSILAKVRNKLEFNTIWENGLLYWETEYKTYGGVETTFVQPVLSANGILGGSSFAVSTGTSVLYGSNQAYYGVDGNLSTNANTAGPTSPLTFIWYFPTGLRATNLALTALSGYPNQMIGNYVIYGSYDNTNYTTILSGTNTTAGNINISMPLTLTEHFNYYKLYASTCAGGAGIGFSESLWSGYYIAT